MEKQLFQVPASIEKVETMADRCLKLSVYTIKELVPEEEASIMRLRNKQGWFVFKETDIEEKDIPDDFVPEFKNEKSPSERLRNVQYKVWELCTNRQTPFEEFRRSEMEKIINKYKDKLNQ